VGEEYLKNISCKSSGRRITLVMSSTNWVTLISLAGDSSLEEEEKNAAGIPFLRTPEMATKSQVCSPMAPFIFSRALMMTGQSPLPGAQFLFWSQDFK
jgi:hypothetical protein